MSERYTAEEYGKLAEQIERAGTAPNDPKTWNIIASALRIASRANEEELKQALAAVAVDLVTQIEARLTDGKLLAYDGIESARAIRDQAALAILNHLHGDKA